MFLGGKDQDSGILEAEASSWPRWVVSWATLFGNVLVGVEQITKSKVKLVGVRLQREEPVNL